MDNPNEKPEEIEGLDKDEDSAFKDYPIDTFLIRTENRTVYDVVRRIENGTYIMNPDFQRDFIWRPDKQSKLIESVLMRIPLPVFYLAENDVGKVIVIDGLQRLTTFQNFVNDKFALKLPEQEELNKKYFKDLSPKLQNRIEDCNLIVYLIDSHAPLRAQLDIFERVNGGVPLSRQQMRNCLFNGRATAFLKEEAQKDLFKSATGGSLRTDTMRDREMINRFCAFQLLGVGAYKGDMDSYLADALKKINDDENYANTCQKLREQLGKGLRNNQNVFDKQAFRKHERGQTKRGTFNASLWDVMSTGLSRYSEYIVNERANNLRRDFYNILNNPEFNESISYSTNNENRVKKRFGMMDEMLKGVFGDK